MKRSLGIVFILISLFFVALTAYSSDITGENTPFDQLFPASFGLDQDFTISTPVIDFRYCLATVYRLNTWDSILNLSVQRKGSGRVDFVNPKILAVIPSAKFSTGAMQLRGKFVRYYVLPNDHSNQLLTNNLNNLGGYGLSAQTIYMPGSAYLGASIMMSQMDSDLMKDIEGTLFSDNFRPALILLGISRDQIFSRSGQRNFIDPNGGTVGLWVYQAVAGLRPFSKLDLGLAFNIIKLDQKSARLLNEDLGRELDFTASYRFFDNLNYMAAFGYLWAGDALKGSLFSTGSSGDWLLMHKLTLNF